MMTTVALIGAGGKIGTRITDNLLKDGSYRLLFSEKGERGLAALQARGLAVTPPDEAVAQADLVILAVPDALMGQVTADLVPRVRAGSTVVFLDPAAAEARAITLRDDLAFVVCHPCHPPLFGPQPAEARDFFGGVHTPQDIVIALLQGDESVFAPAETLCRAIFAPVGVSHRITVAQMAVLEPTMAEVAGVVGAVVMKEALEEAVRRGVPREAATAFMLGHMQTALAILFGAVDARFSDACRVAIRRGEEMILRPDWRRVFEPDIQQGVIEAMLHPEAVA